MTDRIHLQGRILSPSLIKIDETTLLGTLNAAFFTREVEAGIADRTMFKGIR